MDWLIYYKGKAQKGTLRENLEGAGIRYFIPTRIGERFIGDRMVKREETVFSNLIFIQTDRQPGQLNIDGLRAPLINHATGRPAMVSESEMEHFKKVLQAQGLQARFLPDAYHRFENCPHVRVKAGEFEGLEGRVFRIRGDRKLIIQLDEMAVAISGIHHTLLEVIKDE